MSADRLLRRWRTLASFILLSTATGCPDDGVTLPPTRTFPRTTEWPGVTINRGANVLPQVVTVSDLNIDGLPDVIVGYPGGTDSQPQVAVFFQISPTQWTGVSIATGPAVTLVSSLAVGDLNGDGRNDIIAAADGQLVYMRSPPDPVVGQWLVDVIAESSGADLGRWTDVAIVQIDQLFGPDIVAANGLPGRLSWFRAPQFAVTGAGFRRIDIDGNRNSASSILIEDVDRDGNPDVISSARQEQTASIAWYRHPGGNAAAQDLWEKFIIGNLADAHRLGLGDLDRDGRNDVAVISPSQRRVAWFAMPEDVLNSAWNGVVLAEFTQNSPADLKIVDVDVNGQLDAIVATADQGVLRWFTAVNDVRAQWVENNMADPGANVGFVGVADIDRDGRQDVVAPLVAQDSANDQVAWFRNPEL